MTNPKENSLIAQLPGEDLGRLIPFLELVSLPQDKQLYHAGDIAQYVYFPTTSIISIRMDLSDGYSAETAIVGNGGMLGIALLGHPHIFHHAFVRTPGFAYKLPVSVLRQEFERARALMQILLTASRNLIFQMSQNSLCRSHHTVEQQLVRWILITAEKSNSSSITVTHHEISKTLGVRREGISLATKKLIFSGLISGDRGKITVNNREGLLEICCECYTSAKNQRMGYSPAAEVGLKLPSVHAA